MLMLDERFIVGIGEILWDKFPTGKRLGGAPANFAYHAGQFGHESLVISAIGPYSQAIDSGAGIVFVSGQLPIGPATGAFPEGGVKEQTRQSLTNAKAILEAAGLSLANVVKTTVFLADMGDFGAMNEVYAEFFKAPFPARSAVAVKTLPKGALVEIECIAAKDFSGSIRLI